MKISLLRIGNSKGIILPKPLISQLDLSDSVELDISDDSIILRKPRGRARAGWARASRGLAVNADDGLVWPEFPNVEDKKNSW
jgi:antitoxin MazE